RLVEIRLDAVAGERVTLEEEVALGDAQIDDLAVVAADLLLDVLQRAARLRVAFRAVEDQRAAEIELVVLPLDQILPRPERRARLVGRVRQRELAIDPEERFGRALAVAGGERGAAAPVEHLLRRSRSVGGERA